MVSEALPRPPAQPRCALNINLDPALKARLARFAQWRGCFEARVVREALEQYLTANEKRVRP